MPHHRLYERLGRFLSQISIPSNDPIACFIITLNYVQAKMYLSVHKYSNSLLQNDLFFVITIIIN